MQIGGRSHSIIIALWAWVLAGTCPLQAQRLLDAPVDPSADFADFANMYFLANRLVAFDPETGAGTLSWDRTRLTTHVSFNNMSTSYDRTGGNEFPSDVYAVNPELPFSLEFVSPRTVRIRIRTGTEPVPNEPSLMLAGGAAGHDESWARETIRGGYRYSNACGSVTVRERPWSIEFRDAQGRLLTQTVQQRHDLRTISAILPFSFVRRAADYSRSLCAVFSLSQDEKIFGCGETYTNFNKVGDQINLFTSDPLGVQNRKIYKPIPFFLSNRGYGMFVHTSAPATCDFGASFHALNHIFVGDEDLDLFVFLGSPREVLDAYTDLTGKPAMPPLWSFGLWMSRITYFSEEEVRETARQLRANRIPCDVIHLDTGWFENDWQCDYRFSTSRFDDPQKMIQDLKDMGLHVSLWQLPYFVPQNTLFDEILEQGLYVKDAKGGLPYEDAILDFSNPQTVSWYQEKIGALLKMGVGAIKADFGEAAPYDGLYASGKTGFYEHNLYPLRYNQAAAEITEEVTGDTIIWARSAWAGSQRYPVHWGGDNANTDEGMAASLRGGLSFGLSGFAFWSHDIGGFAGRPPTEVYRRWTPFGMLTSHSRCHGAPPKEPWYYGEEFMDEFRRAVELKYRLMPYVYAQAKDCTERGLPMIRALFIDYPEDPGAWLIDNEYLFGSDLLVAPLFEAETDRRQVYVPTGRWIDYQTHEVYGNGWHEIRAGEIPIVLLVREGAALPYVQLAQSTQDIDWSRIEWRVFADPAGQAKGLICLPADNELRAVTFVPSDQGFRSQEAPPAGVAFNVLPYTASSSSETRQQ